MVRQIVWCVVLTGLVVAGCEQRTEKSGPKPGPAGPSPAADAVTEGTPATSPQTGASDAATKADPANSDQPAHEPTKTSAVPPKETAKESPAEPAQPKLDPDQLTKVKALVKEMASEASLERRHAMEELDALGPTALDPYLLAMLQTGTDLEKRGTVAYLIGRVTLENQAQVAALIGFLGATDETLRHNAFQALERVGEQQLLNALPQLIAQAKNGSEDKAYRVRAMRAVAKLGEAARGSTPEILQIAGDASVPELQRAAIDAVAKVAAADEAEKFYVQLLQTSQEVDLRRLAASRLLQTANSEVAVNGLISAFKDSSADVRNEAAKTLVAIGRPAVPFMIKGLEDPDPRVRRCVVQTLGVLTNLANDAVPALKERLKDSDPQVRALAGAALKRIQGR